MSFGQPSSSASARLSWGLKALEIEALWGRGLKGAGVLVGHLDTGVRADHPALVDRVEAFVEFDEWGNPIQGQMARDTAGHGSHTAGIVCGASIENELIGVAPQARLLSAAVIDDGNNVVRILRGLSWLREKGIRVLCMALGIPSENPIFWTMLWALKASGVLTVCPIGNHGSALSHAPGNYPFVLSVGAVDKDGKISSSTGRASNSQGQCTKPELLAPGVCIPSISPFFGSAATRSGTSQACAFVAGACALLFQAFPQATPDDMAWALSESAKALDEGRGSRYRHGFLNLEGALNLLAKGRAPSSSRGQSHAEPPFYRDPGLGDDLREQAGNARHDCVWITVEDMDAKADARGPAGPLMDMLCNQLGESPIQAGYVPEGRVGFARASKRFVEALWRSPQVLVLSAARARNRNPFPF